MNAIAARAEAVRRYFTKTPGAPSYALAIFLTICAVLAAAPALIAIGSQGEEKFVNDLLGCVAIVFSILAAGLGSFAALSFTLRRNRYLNAYRNAEPKPSDAEIDAWHAADISRLQPYALYKLDLIEEQVRADNPKGPLIVIGSGPAPQLRRGLDGVIRFSSHEILIIWLTTYHLAAFKCVKDLRDGSIQTETTQEYHYNDVVSVSTQKDNSILTYYWDGQPRQMTTHQRFAISVASGEQISVAVDFTASLQLEPNSRFAETGADAAIRSIRTRLREKKGGSIDTADHGTLL